MNHVSGITGAGPISRKEYQLLKLKFNLAINLKKLNALLMMN